VEIATKVGSAEIVGRVVDDLKDEAEQYRKMVMETIDKIMSSLGASDVDSRLEEQLIDGILYAFQEQTTEVGDAGDFRPFSQKFEWNSLQHLDCSQNPLDMMQGFLLVEIDSNIILLIISYAEKTLIDTGVCLQHCNCSLNRK